MHLHGTIRSEDGANMRGQPQGRIISELKDGERVEILERDYIDGGEWYKVRTRQGREGYVWAALLHVESAKHAPPAKPHGAPEKPKPAPVAEKHSVLRYFLAGLLVAAAGAALYFAWTII